MEVFSLGTFLSSCWSGILSFKKILFQCFLKLYNNNFPIQEICTINSFLNYLLERQWQIVSTAMEAFSLETLLSSWRGEAKDYYSFKPFFCHFQKNIHFISFWPFSVFNQVLDFYSFLKLFFSFSKSKNFSFGHH